MKMPITTKLEIDESIIHSQLKINVRFAHLSVLAMLTFPLFKFTLQTENDELQSLIDAAMSERDKTTQQNALPYKTVKPKPGRLSFFKTMMGLIGQHYI